MYESSDNTNKWSVLLNKMNKNAVIQYCVDPSLSSSCSGVDGNCWENLWWILIYKQSTKSGGLSYVTYPAKQRLACEDLSILLLIGKSGRGKKKKVLAHLVLSPPFDAHVNLIGKICPSSVLSYWNFSEDKVKADPYSCM